MSERVYTDYPELYDAIQSDWDYDRDVSFVTETLTERGVEGKQLLEIGCGTGEHTRRLVAEGFDVTAVDKYDGMLGVAKNKCNVDFRRMALPDIAIDEDFDVVVAMRGVLNHVPREDLAVSLEALADLLEDGGVLIFDNSPLPPDGNHPALDVGTVKDGDYARIAQHVPAENGRLDWREVVFTPDGDFFVNSRKMTPYDDGTIATALSELGFSVQTSDGYGPDDHRAVFVATA